jgi:hypothetical protein
MNRATEGDGIRTVAGKGCYFPVIDGRAIPLCTPNEPPPYMYRIVTWRIHRYLPRGKLNTSDHLDSTLGRRRECEGSVVHRIHCGWTEWLDHPMKHPRAPDSL